jgi:phosphotransferase system  glucose/maltose/N-acetylglucosamine-specific IIC component
MLHLNLDVFAFFNEWKTVLLAIAAVGVAGLAAGLFYRVGAAIALALATMISGVYLGIGNGWAVWQSILYAIGLLTVLQLAYLLGAGLSVTASRASSRASLRTFIAGLFKQKTAR